MMRLLFKIFISLYVFLLSGYGQLDAHADNNPLSLTSSKSTENFGYSHSSTLQNDKFCTFLPVNSFAEKENLKFRATDNEDEEDDLSGFKYLAINNCFTAVFYGQVSGYFCCRYVKKGLTYSNLFSYFSINKYIVFRVIRI